MKMKDRRKSYGNGGVYWLCLLFMVLVLVVVCSVLWRGRSDSIKLGIRIRRRMAMQSATSSMSNITLVCQATRFPNVCYSSLISQGIGGTAHSQQLVGVSISVAFQGVNQSQGLSQQLLQKSASDIKLAAVARNCAELLGYSKYWLRNSMRANLRRKSRDIQHWLSGVLTYQNDCSVSLGKSNGGNPMVKRMLAQVASVEPLISNALSMVAAFAVYGDNPVHWKPPSAHRRKMAEESESESESDAEYYPSWMHTRDRILIDGSPEYLLPSITVANDGSSACSSIQQAVDSAPDYGDSRFIIYIKEGIYPEIVRVPLSKSWIMLLGDGINRTIITGNKNVALQQGMTTYDSATLGVIGKGFLARDMTVENTAGPEGHQAVALRVDSDLSAFQSCSFLGHQDTLYTHAFRQFYRDCRVEGTIDYIFGNSAAVFQNCDLVVRPGNPLVILSTVTAQGRLDPAQPTALVFQNCTVNGTEEFMKGFFSNPKQFQAFLGRPWKLYSRTIFLHAYLEALIMPEGWMPWNGSYALDTLFYGEYMSVGPGASRASRVPWSTQLTLADAVLYSVQSFIQGQTWLPAANVPFSENV